MSRAEARLAAIGVGALEVEGALDARRAVTFTCGRKTETLASDEVTVFPKGASRVTSTHSKREREVKCV